MSKNVLVNLFFLSILFPYTTIKGFGVSDSQPWYFVLGLMLITLHLRKIRLTLLDFLFVFSLLTSSLVLTAKFLFLGLDLVLFLRQTFKYLGVVVASIVAYIYVDRFSRRIFKYSVYLWVALANLQFITRRRLISDYLLYAPRGNVHRSFVISFAPEPAYLAKMCFFFLILLEYLHMSKRLDRKSYFILVVLLLETMAITFSLTALFLIIFYSFYIMLKFLTPRALKIWDVIFASLTAIVVIVLSMFFQEVLRKLPGNRLVSFLKNVLKSGELLPLILSDPSFLGRFYMIKYNYESVFVEKSIYGWEKVDRPMGSLLAFLGDSGILGLVVIFLMIVYAIRVLRRNGLFGFLLSGGFILLTFSESLATGYIGFLVGLMMRLSRRKSMGDEKAWNSNIS